MAPLKSSTGVVQNANQFVAKKLPFVPVHVVNQPVTASKDILDILMVNVSQKTTVSQHQNAMAQEKS